MTKINVKLYLMDVFEAVKNNAESVSFNDLHVLTDKVMKDLEIEDFVGTMDEFQYEAYIERQAEEGF